MNSPATSLPPPRGPKSPLTLRTVTEGEAGQRIDNFLMRHFKTVPRSRVYRLLRKGEMRVHRNRVEAGSRTQAGDEAHPRQVRSVDSAEPRRPPRPLLH